MSSICHCKCQAGKIPFEIDKSLITRLYMYNSGHVNVGKWVLFLMNDLWYMIIYIYLEIPNKLVVILTMKI